MEQIMTRIISFSSSGRRRVTKPGLTRAARIAARVLGTCALLSTTPATARNYCLSGDANMDCSFTSLAQCEATASGGLGECKMVVTGFDRRGPQAFYLGHAPRRGGAK
jgi:hypothetical protein